MRFSKKTGCFYPKDIEYVELPDDLIDVSQENFTEAMTRNPGDTLDVVEGRVAVVPKPAPTATEAKATKLGAIKAERDRRKSCGFKVKVGSSNRWFHSDADSRIQHLGLKDKARDLLAAGGQITNVLQANGRNIDNWKTLDGSIVSITAQTAFDLVAAAADLDAELHAVAEHHKAAVMASTDPFDYDFLTGWPEVFMPS